VHPIKKVDDLFVETQKLIYLLHAYYCAFFFTAHVISLNFESSRLFALTNSRSWVGTEYKIDAKVSVDSMWYLIGVGLHSADTINFNIR
jgi:hypothetical protein